MRSFLLPMIILACFAGQLSAQYGTYNVPAGSPMANGEHPRLFFTASSFNDIANYINTHESGDFQQWINGRDSEYNQNVGSKERKKLLWQACNFAFMYYARQSGQLNGYSWGHSADQYAAKAYDHAVEIDDRIRNQGLREFRASIGGSEGGYITMSLGLVYDWCNDYLTLAQKQFIADAFIWFKDRETNARCFPGNGMNIGNDFNSQCWEVGFWGGAAMYGDDLGGSYTAGINNLKDVIGWFVFDQVFDVQNVVHEGTAGNGEGGAYYGVTLQQQLFQAGGIGPAVGVDFAQQYGSIRDGAWFYWNLGQPRRWENGSSSGWWKHRFDDVWLSGWSGGGAQTNMGPLIGMVKESDPDYAGAMRWMMEDARGGLGTSQPLNSFNDPDIYWLWFKFLWGYKDVAKKSPTEYPLPKANRFGMGETIMQSDFTTQDATKILFYTHKWFVNLHHHDDYGGFEIFKNGLLILNCGGNWKNSNSLGIEPVETQDPAFSVFHSIMAIYTGSNSTYGRNQNITPDADTPDHPANQIGGQNHLGNIVASKNLEDVFDFYDYDYARTYKGSGYVNTLRRKMLYIRDPNAPNYSNAEEYVILVDDVDLTTNHARRWSARTVYEPVPLDGGSWTTVGTGHKTANNTEALEITNTYANNNGRLYMKILSPDNYTLRLRGTASEPFPDANGNSLRQGGNTSEAARNFSGTYRMEIEDNASSPSSDYLVVMQVGTATDLTTMAPMERIDSGDFFGTVINNNRVAMFNKSTTAAPAVAYSATVTGNARHYITGLEPGAYFVRADGNIVSGVNNIVDQSGVLYFEHSGGSNFSISKSNDTTAPATPANVRVSK